MAGRVAYAVLLAMVAAGQLSLAQREPPERDPDRRRLPVRTRPAMRCDMPLSAAAAHVSFTGDWPATRCCNLNVAPGPRVVVPIAACNDNISGAIVPWGMSAEICENDGVGGNLGKCRRFLPGASFVGDDMNDIGTSFLVENRMIAYLNSADYPVGIKITVGVTGSDPGVGALRPTGEIGYDGTWITQTYAIDVPSSCRNLRFVELTKSGDAEWYGQVDGSPRRLQLRLSIKPRALGGSNNWVGVELRCEQT